MKIHKCLITIIMLSTFIFHSVFALTLGSSSFNHNGAIPYEYLYCKPNKKGVVIQGGNVSPELHWSMSPLGTKSYVLLLSDSDVAKVNYFNSKKKMIKLNEPRVTMFHWVIANIPVNIQRLPKGAGAKGFLRAGLTPGKTRYGLMGLNLYNVSFQLPLSQRITFGKDVGKDMRGVYGRYGGMCAPFNDERIHNYVFTLYALDTDKLDLPEDGKFTGDKVMRLMKGHVIESAILVGKSVTNPKYLDDVEKTKNQNRV